MLTGTTAMRNTTSTVLRGLNGTVWNVVADGTISSLDAAAFGAGFVGVGVGVVGVGEGAGGVGTGCGARGAGRAAAGDGVGFTAGVRERDGLGAAVVGGGGSVQIG
jgi:hypothetical protein